MEKKTFNYPGDPELEALELTGLEFITLIRGGEPGYIQVNDDPPLYFDEVICDLCNALIEAEDQCLLIGQRMLYCAECSIDKQQYLNYQRAEASTKASPIANSDLISRAEAVREHASEFCENWSLPTEAEVELQEFIAETFAAAQLPTQSVPVSNLREKIEALALVLNPRAGNIRPIALETLLDDCLAAIPDVIEKCRKADGYAPASTITTIYHCSCGAACTASEYIDHHFKQQHDRCST